MTKRRGARLPHWTRPGATYFITYRLGDSLPAPLVRSIHECVEEAVAARERRYGRPLTAPERSRLRLRLAGRAERYLDRGRGECLLRNPRAAQIVVENLAHHAHRYALHAWCVMPNHVHLLVTPYPGEELEALTHSWKSYTSNEINRALTRTGKVWQTESFDHLVRSDESHDRFVAYVLDNPRKAGLHAWRFVGLGVPT